MVHAGLADLRIHEAAELGYREAGVLDVQAPLSQEFLRKARGFGECQKKHEQFGAPGACIYLTAGIARIAVDDAVYIARYLAGDADILEFEDRGYSADERQECGDRVAFTDADDRGLAVGRYCGLYVIAVKEPDYEGYHMGFLTWSSTL